MSPIHAVPARNGIWAAAGAGKSSKQSSLFAARAALLIFALWSKARGGRRSSRLTMLVDEKKRQRDFACAVYSIQELLAEVTFEKRLFSTL
jgi:hypothetical protein